MKEESDVPGDPDCRRPDPTAKVQAPTMNSIDPPAEAADHHVVIIGGGFGGLYAAKVLGKADIRVTLIDKRNFHLFQPLLYQVATGGLSPGDVAAPLRAVVKRHRRTRVLAAHVDSIDVDQRHVLLESGDVVAYDDLIVATGMQYHYFGSDRLAAGNGQPEDGGRRPRHPQPHLRCLRKS